MRSVHSGPMKVSIVIPTLNEVAVIERTLEALQPMRGADVELILADGGSVDGTQEAARSLVDRVVESSAGRARQMNAGAAVAHGRWLWFVHADTRVPTDALQHIVSNDPSKPHLWGRFDVRLDSKRPMLRLVERMMNLRSCLTGVATGDQCLFVQREWFDLLGGFADVPLMEDIELSKRLRRVCPPVCVRSRVVTSARRWEQRGVLRTILLMWFLRAAYFLGISPDRIAEWYR